MAPPMDRRREPMAGGSAYGTIAVGDETNEMDNSVKVTRRSSLFCAVLLCAVGASFFAFGVGKSAGAPAASLDVRVAGPPQIAGYTLLANRGGGGGDKLQALENMTPTQCAKACNAAADCVAFSYHADKAHCKLKSGAFDTTSFEDAPGRDVYVNTAARTSPPRSRRCTGTAAAPASVPEPLACMSPPVYDVLHIARPVISSLWTIDGIMP